MAIGDFGTGIRHPSTPDRQQREVAAALEKAVDAHDVRLILTTGDNIYAGRTLLGVPVGATGDEDDDWFFTYYQPYRYILNRIPVYPSIGNHDGDETEVNDDRDQVLDNFYVAERLAGEEQAGRASVGPGLNYRFRHGSDIELVCIDSSRRFLLFGQRFFRHPEPRAVPGGRVSRRRPRRRRAGGSRSRTTRRTARGRCTGTRSPASSTSCPCTAAAACAWC